MWQVKPIGYVRYRKEVVAPKEVGPRDRYPFPELVEIHVDPAYREALLGVEHCSHLLVLYWLHLIPREHAWQGHRYGDPTQPLLGSFATRSPYRPNPIGVTEVRLILRKDNILTVAGLDAFPDTPVLDIKGISGQ